MTIWMLGAAGALVALGGFALGFFVGKNSGRGTQFRRVDPLPGEGTGPLEEEMERQAAFETLMRYSADHAYGLKGADE